MRRRPETISWTVTNQQNRPINKKFLRFKNEFYLESWKMLTFTCESLEIWWIIFLFKKSKLLNYCKLLPLFSFLLPIFKNTWTSINNNNFANGHNFWVTVSYESNKKATYNYMHRINQFFRNVQFSELSFETGPSCEIGSLTATFKKFLMCLSRFRLQYLQTIPRHRPPLSSNGNNRLCILSDNPESIISDREFIQEPATETET